MAPEDDKQSDEVPTSHPSAPVPVQAAVSADHPYWEEDEISLLDLVSVLLRHRQTITALAILVPVLVVAVSLLLPRSYTANASFMPQTGQRAASSQLASLAGQFGFDIPTGVESGQSPQFYANLLTSREILGAVAADTFAVADTTGLFAQGRLRGTLASLLDVDEGSAEKNRAAVIEWLRENAISASADQETGVVDVSIVTPWPELSGQIAGRLIELTNEFNLETRQSQAAAERRFIEERRKAARADLRAAENELEAFLRSNRQFQNSPELVFQHDRLQRQVTRRQQVYTSLSEAYEQARINEVRNTPVITVVEEAEPPVKPDSRMLPLKAALGLLAGGVLGVCAAFGREYVERSREERADEFSEVSSLWDEAKSDVTSVVRRIRHARSGSTTSEDEPTETYDR